jgi:hypothetical protein
MMLHVLTSFPRTSLSQLCIKRCPVFVNTFNHSHEFSQFRLALNPAMFTNNNWTRSYFITDIRCTLHAKPLGVSMTWSAHPGQRGIEWERTIGKKAGGGGEKDGSPTHGVEVLIKMLTLACSEPFWPWPIRKIARTRPEGPSEERSRSLRDFGDPEGSTEVAPGPSGSSRTWNGRGASVRVTKRYVKRALAARSSSPLTQQKIVGSSLTRVQGF